MVTLYHAPHTRALRVVWTLEELGEPYELRATAFPPKDRAPEYMDVNPAGTLPAMVDGEVALTESMAMCEYLADKHSSALIVPAGDRARPEYLQWLWFGEATLMTPIGILVRLMRIKPQEEAFARVAEDAKHALGLRLAALERRLDGRSFLAADRFTLADISAGYALYLCRLLKADEAMGPAAAAYWDSLKERPAFQRASAAK